MIIKSYVSKRQADPQEMKRFYLILGKSEDNAKNLESLNSCLRVLLPYHKTPLLTFKLFHESHTEADHFLFLY